MERSRAHRRRSTDITWMDRTNRSTHYAQKDKQHSKTDRSWTGLPSSLHSCRRKKVATRTSVALTRGPTGHVVMDDRFAPHPVMSGSIKSCSAQRHDSPYVLGHQAHPEHDGTIRTHVAPQHETDLYVVIRTQRQRQGRRLKKWRQRLIILDYQGRKHPSSEHTARPDRCRCPDARLEEIVQQEQGGRDDAVQTQGWCRNREVQEIESGISGISGQRTSKTKRAGATVIEPARASGADLGWA